MLQAFAAVVGSLAGKKAQIARKRLSELTEELDNELASTQKDYDPDYDNDTELGLIVDEIFREIEEYLPEGLYAGASVGDGADFGIWIVEDAENEFDDD